MCVKVLRRESERERVRERVCVREREREKEKERETEARQLCKQRRGGKRDATPTAHICASSTLRPGMNEITRPCQNVMKMTVFTWSSNPGEQPSREQATRLPRSGPNPLSRCISRIMDQGQRFVPRQTWTRDGTASGRTWWPCKTEPVQVVVSAKNGGRKYRLTTSVVHWHQQDQPAGNSSNYTHAAELPQ